jgi:cytoskeletal protein RodZ
MTIDNEIGDNRQHQSRNSVGALLREARESLGLDLRDVARGLRIRFPYLQGIENDDYAQLPGKTYVLGFLRSYAEYLGLDGEDVIARYRRQLDDRDLPATSLHFPLHAPEARMPRGAVLILSLVLAAGAVYGGARWMGDEGMKTVDRVAPVPDRLIGEPRPTPAPSFTPRNDPSSAFAAVTPQPTDSGASASVLSQPTPPAPAAPPAQIAALPTPAPAEPASSGIAPRTEPPAGTQAIIAETVRIPAPPKPAKPEPARVEPPKPTPQQQTQALNQGQQAQPQQPTQTAALPPAPKEIVVVARVDSWIEVRDGSNKPLASLLLRVGDSYRVPEGANYRLVTGDVRGLEVRVDGVAVRQRGVDDNKPHRALSLDAERLRTGNAVAD